MTKPDEPNTVDEASHDRQPHDAGTDLVTPVRSSDDSEASTGTVGESAADGESATAVTSDDGRHVQTLLRLCDTLGHDFYDMELLRRSVTHRSFRNESASVATDNQRLEFLGDSVIGLVVADRLFRAIPGAAEGLLTVLKARCVSEPALAEIARRIRLGEVLRLGRGERRRGGALLDSVLADALEAVMGAVFVDGGYLAVSKAVARVFKAELDATVHAGRDGHGLATRISGGAGATRNWKTPLQERLQERGLAHPEYQVVNTVGPPHRRTFTVEVSATLHDDMITAQGDGFSKKTAAHEAAKLLMERLEVMWSK